MMLENSVFFRYPHLFKIAQSITAALILISLGSTTSVSGGGVLWFIGLFSLIVSVTATVLFLLDKSDVIQSISGGQISWNLVEFVYSSILGILCLLGAWLSFSYAGHVPTGESGMGYVFAGLFLVAQTTLYSAPALMLYEKIQNTEGGIYRPDNNYAFPNDADIPYQTPAGNPPTRMV
uniref:MARVEL domain-containing protein n=1 Tax=Panagrolaimus sp. ES5 TaxID=591445 RepID=A0AC34FT74_9BILA